MKILIIGAGGREHALAWKMAQDKAVDRVFVAPGNAGTALESRVVNVEIDACDLDGLVQFANEEQVDLTVVGPEAPLVAGVVDRFEAAGLTIFGPSSAASRLEGSKVYAKDFLRKYAIPTAEYGCFTEIDPARAFVRSMGAPIVVKADGLAAGKGVVLAESEEQAFSAIDDMLAGNAFGEAGHRVVIEEFLSGEEVSFIVMVDGKHVVPLATSQDHKARDEGDSGPNTGGMGAYSPAPLVDEELHRRVMQEIILPTVEGMAQEGCAYKGFLYAGLMIDGAGNPKVLEFNCRMGDPETQPIMMRLQSSLSALCLAGAIGELDRFVPQWDNRSALGVVMAAGGYPGSCRKGDVITGIGSASETGAKVFYAGVQLRDGTPVTDGGRVLCVAALGDSVKGAQQDAYRAVSRIQWADVYFRRDIGHRAVTEE